ncbi:MAG: SEC-C domain-containing protein [Clostridia bacterium]|nr:SEC-C domain-containing protein [Clostridia bacterium]
MPASTIKHAEAPKATSEGQKQMPSATAAPNSRENVYGRAAKPEKQSAEPYVKPKSEQVGRNDPCPCGSGLKYKKCCMLKNENSSDK